MGEKEEMNPHELSVDEVFSRLGSKKEGLSDEAVKKQREKSGKNVIEGKEQKSLFRLFLDQVNNPIIYLLIGATVISFAFGDIPEAIAIVVVIVLNTGIGFWMEYQARTSIKALKKLDRLESRVRRNNDVVNIDAADIVPGDVLELEAGDVVPADARIFSITELKVDESPLTGESIPVEKNQEPVDKDTELAGRTNMVFKGTAITNGKAVAVVTSTGKSTEIGKISEMAEREDKDKIPLNIKLRKLSHRLIWVTAGLATAFFVIGWLSGKEIYLMLQTAIAWTVAAIPEGLPIVASIALARGMLRLAKRNVLVKKLAAVETLGETTVIFTDKTGTLTENKLTLETIACPGNDIQVKKLSDRKQRRDAGNDSGENECLKHILRVSVFCNDANEDEKGKYKGDPLDVSLMESFNKYKSDKIKKLRKLPLINEDPFDSESKFMGTVHEVDDDLYVSGKGAAEVILSRSKSYLENGALKDISDEFKKKWVERNEEFSGKGLKVIACSYKTIEKGSKNQVAEEADFVSDMNFIGLLTFIDPAKNDIKDAIEKCKQAGIKIVMVTGDHPGTAANVAEKVGLSDEIEVMKGKEVAEDGDQVYNSNLFARVDPEQKYNIVEKYKKEGEITAMTGDGVNDAPALKKADIGIAMGKRGTQMAREVADMILKDDAFPSIVNAVEEGRIIFENIRKFIVYQLSYHFAEILIIAGISFSLFYLPLLPLQLLFLNLLSDVFPALALGLGKGDDSIMKRKPKDPKEPIINKRNWLSMGIYGLVMAVVITGAYLLVLLYFDQSKEIANTVTFFSLAISQLVHVFNMREHNENVFKNQVVRNKFIWMALAFCFSALIAAYLIPLFRNALSFEKLALQYWLIIGAASLTTLIIIQVVKQIFKL